MNARPLQFAALVAFCLSGFAALLYQVVWQRMLVFFTGADVHASTLIVAAFMAGLGLGNLLGGVLADRLSPRNALVGFAVAETAIAAFSLLSRWIYYDLLYQQLGARQLGATVLIAVLSVNLLWPTFCLTGIAAGAWVGSLLAPRLRRPTITSLRPKRPSGCWAACWWLCWCEAPIECCGCGSISAATNRWQSGRKSTSFEPDRCRSSFSCCISPYRLRCCCRRRS